jgi:hypothetical protein
MNGGMRLLLPWLRKKTFHTRIDSFKPRLHDGGLRTSSQETEMLGTILLIILVLMLIGAMPSWGYSRAWGYGPSGGVGLLLIIIVVLLLMGRI